MKSLQLAKVYQLLEPGPVVLVTTVRNGRANIMTQSWHMMIEFEPLQIACIVSDSNYSFAALRETGECVIAIPARKLATKVVAIGNSSGREVDKFTVGKLFYALLCVRKRRTWIVGMDSIVSRGLTNDEVRRRRQEFGPNTVPNSTRRPLFALARKFWAPVPCLLEAAIVLQISLGEYVEASIIGGLLVFNAAIGFLHERRAQMTIAALKSRLALNASARRDGSWRTVPAVDLVPGDVIKLSLGGVVPADVRLIEGAVMLDHSMLTGESLPIEGGAGRDTYAGALVRRGEAIAEVTATGVRTKFGRGVELIRTAYVVSSQQKAVFRVVRNLAGFNGFVTILLLAYAYTIGMPVSEFVPLLLISVLACVPVALPATFTLATALGARALAQLGVLPTRLSAVDEAASMSVLCADKTGTLTLNELQVATTCPMTGFDESHILALAALASSDGGLDPVDAAIRRANHGKAIADLPRLIKFIPFDPATKMSEASVMDPAGATLRVVKGAFAVVDQLSKASPIASATAARLEQEGFRVLGLAVGAASPLQLAGLMALSDPPRPEAKSCIDDLRRLGVRTLMVTGDAPETATVVAHAVGIEGTVCPTASISAHVQEGKFGIFAGGQIQACQRAATGRPCRRHVRRWRE